jgi:hypothetical protein
MKIISNLYLFSYKFISFAINNSEDIFLIQKPVLKIVFIDLKIWRPCSYVNKKSSHKLIRLNAGTYKDSLISIHFLPS